MKLVLAAEAREPTGRAVAWAPACSSLPAPGCRVLAGSVCLLCALVPCSGLLLDLILLLELCFLSCLLPDLGVIQVSSIPNPKMDLTAGGGPALFFPDALSFLGSWV